TPELNAARPLRLRRETGAAARAQNTGGPARGGRARLAGRAGGFARAGDHLVTGLEPGDDLRARPVADAGLDLNRRNHAIGQYVYRRLTTGVAQGGIGHDDGVVSLTGNDGHVGGHIWQEL